MEVYQNLKNKDYLQQDNEDDMNSTASWSPIIKSRKRFLKEETELLEKKYAADINPSISEIQELANQIGTTKKIITTWFQNRRAKEKRKEKKITKYNKKIKPSFNNHDKPQNDPTNLTTHSSSNTLLHYMAPLYSHLDDTTSYPYDDHLITSIPITPTTTVTTTTTLAISNHQQLHPHFTSLPTMPTFYYWPLHPILTTEHFHSDNHLSIFDSPLNRHHAFIPLQEEDTNHLHYMDNHPIHFPFICCVEGCFVDFPCHLHS